MTKKIVLGIATLGLILTSCSNILDNNLNKEDFPKVKEKINGNSSYGEKKKAYILDNLSVQLAGAEMGKALNMDTSVMPTFKEVVDDLSESYDSINTAKLNAMKTNKQLEDFIVLKDASTAGLDKYKGYLSMTLDFNNHFNKEVLYIVLGYKYIDKYDSKYFEEKVKLTDEVAGDFKHEIEVTTTEEYNDVADFIYTKVPVQAKQSLRDELGEEVADKKVEKDYLMAGLKLNTLLVVFKDKSKIVYEDPDWKYLDK